jgi:1-acyl-sn-glycerol-3-phosphate acyltransferase
MAGAPRLAFLEKNMSSQTGAAVPSGFTLGDRLRSIAFAVMFFGGSVLLGLFTPITRRHVAANRWMCEHWSAWQRWCTNHILRIPVVIEGVLPTGRVLIAIKHEAMFEAVDLPNLLDHPAIFAKVELMKVPGWGMSGFAYGLVPVERDQGAKALRAMISAARKFTAEDRPLVIFPEGTRMMHGSKPPLQSGFAGIYKLIGLPVVPIAVNSGPVFRGFWKRRGVITYRVGEMIPAGLPREEIEARVVGAINALND